MKGQTNLALAMMLSGCWWQAPPDAPPRTDQELHAACYPEDIGKQATDTSACFELARRHIAGASPSEQTVKYLKRACTGHPEACVELGLLQLEGKGIPADEVEARGSFGVGCNHSSGNACGWTALLATRFHVDNRAITEGDFQYACRYGDTGWPCYNYGVALACGYFGAPDVPFARHVLDRGCTLGDGRACTVSNRLQVDPDDRPVCTLIGPDPDHPVDLELDLTPGPPDLTPDPEHVRRWRAPMRSPLP